MSFNEDNVSYIVSEIEQVLRLLSDVEFKLDDYTLKNDINDAEVKLRELKQYILDSFYY